MQLIQYPPKIPANLMASQENRRHTLLLHQFGVICLKVVQKIGRFVLSGWFWGGLLFFFFQYLNTVIPYEKKGSPPSVEDLQMLTNSEYSFKLPFWGRTRHFASPWCGRFGTQMHILHCCSSCDLGASLQRSQFGVRSLPPLFFFWHRCSTGNLRCYHPCCIIATKPILGGKKACFAAWQHSRFGVRISILRHCSTADLQQTTPLHFCTLHQHQFGGKTAFLHCHGLADWG